MGWVLGQSVTIDSGNGSPPRVTTYRFVGSGEKVRMESVIPSGRMARQPTVLIIDADAGTMVGITEATRSATLSKRPPMPPFARPVVSNLKSSADTVGPGPVMFGKPTTHVRLRTSSTMTQTYAGMTCTRDNSSESEMWIVADPAVARIQREIARVLAVVTPGTVGAALQRQDTASTFKALMIHRGAGADGKPFTVTTTTTVTEYHQGPIDAGLLAVPAGYSVQDLTQMSLPNMPNMQSILAQAQARAFWIMYDSTAVLPNGKKACERR
jgi:hypothetical protein